MARPKTDLMDWVWEPMADEGDERCESVFREKFRCVAPAGHTSSHWAPDPPSLLPWTWFNKAPIVFKRPEPQP